MDVRWRLGILAALFIVPILGYAGAGAWLLWENGWLGRVWWLLPVCWGAASLLAWRWRRRAELIMRPTFVNPEHWTERDDAAWKVVAARAESMQGNNLEQLIDPSFYLQTAQSLAAELAHVYHPHSTDPVGGLTVPEILAAGEIALADLAKTVDQYIPGNHLLTVDRWRMLAKIPGYYKQANNAYWLLAGLINPVGTAARFVASRMGVNPAVQILQNNALGWFGAAFVQKTGASFIEMYSGRLRVGATRWRELQARVAGVPKSAPAPASKVEPGKAAEGAAANVINIVLVGQVNAGKSSLINALLGQQRAATNVIPLTTGGQRYELAAPDNSDLLSLVDTQGYGHGGPGADGMKKTRDLVQASDLVLVVLGATNAAKEADRLVLESLDAWYQANPQLRRPPILGVLTHIDGLSPALEWSPPYDGWRQPDSPRRKEQSIRNAVAFQLEQLGKYLDVVVPVCTDGEHNRVYGVREWLLPQIVAHLGEARSASLVRCALAEANADQVNRVVRQLWESGKTLLRAAVVGK